ncbi:MAG: hypothetical protein AAGG48_28620 [Planctomycetota bacterium]
MTDFSGIWELIGYAYINDELPLINGGTSVADMQSWLIGSSDANQKAIESCGLRIEIDDGHFSETVTGFSELMFDIEGIQVSDYQPMRGRVHSIGSIGFLLPHGVPDYASPSIENELAARYADGDTVVCDSIRLVDNNLIRKAAVITDEFYVDRVVLEYRIATGT